ncbi:MAG: reprolysin-like metallopeptidase, partial [Saprospiraceae bacterium]
MRSRILPLLFSLILVVSGTTIFAQSISPFQVATENLTGQEIQFLDVQTGVVLPKGDQHFELTLPTPDGIGLTVDLIETTAFPASMKAKYPEIKTYRGYANSSGALVAVLQEPKGISVYVKEVNGPSWQIEPIGTGRARMGTSFAISGEEDIVPLSCGYVPSEENEVAPSGKTENLQARQGQVVKRKYILALACTGEFGLRNGGTKASVNATYAQALNVLNGITLSEVAAEFELHPLNDTLIFVNPSTDPYIATTLGTSLLGENPPVINSRIGVNTYDVGHVFTNRCDDVGGVVSGRACDNNGKARGVTCDGSGNISRTVETIMVHEVAHQFAVSHSWNNCPGNDGQRAGQGAFEPGSG